MSAGVLIRSSNGVFDGDWDNGHSPDFHAAAGRDRNSGLLLYERAETVPASSGDVACWPWHTTLTSRPYSWQTPALRSPNLTV